jgi:hypothetical protein
LVSRPRLIERLNEGLHGRLTLISAPAGFGKTTLVSEWLTGCTAAPCVRSDRLAWSAQKVRDVGMPLLSVNCITSGKVQPRN